MTRACSQILAMTLAIVGLSSAFAQDAVILKDWKGLTPNPELLVDGTPALAWPDIAKNTTVTALGAPTDLTPFETISFSVHVKTPTDSILSLIFTSENPETKGSDYYSTSIHTDFSGWREYRISRHSLGGVRRPVGWNSIQKIFFNSLWSHKLDPETIVHFTPIVLDPEPIPGMDTPPGELLINRGFEIAAPGKNVPTGWGISTFGTKTTVALDRDCAHTGLYSTRIVGASGSNRGGITKGFGPDDTDPAALYLMSAWVRTEGTADSSLGTSVRFTSVAKNDVVLKSDYRKCTPGPFDWRFHTWLVALPEDTERFNIVLFHHGDGTAWWDDVSLRRTQVIKALSPQLNAAIEDPTPEFHWEATDDATGKLVISSTLGDNFHLEVDVHGNHHRLANPLPQGRGYQWYVLLDNGDTSRIIAFEGEEGPTIGEFYAGSWQERIRSQIGDLTEYRTLYKSLKPLAERNGMWDPFSLLGDLLDAVDALEAGKQLPKGTTIDDLLASLEELRLRVPWWRRIFLGDEDFFAGLRLDLPELANVRDAVEHKDYTRARKELMEYYRSRTAPSYYRKWESRPSINPSRTTDVKAEQLLTHKMSIHSYKEPTFDLTPEFNWHIFPIIDVEWPTKIHRHFHWSSLAGAYWGTDNDIYAKEIALQLLDWGEDNPMERWDKNRHRWAWSTLNTTIRIYSSWINAWLRVRSSDAWTPDVQFTMLNLLREHGRFLMTHHARTGNWVVAEARGLVELGIMFPEFKEAEAWKNEGFRRLRNEIEVQVLPDGIHVERTPGYHSMTLSCFLEPLKLALLNDVDFEGRERYLSKLESMYELYLYGGRPDRRMAQIGDAGNMSVVPLLRRGWDMFGRKDMLYIATQGDDGSPPVHRSYAFEHGGFYVSRSAWNDENALWSIMDWGGFVGHCHEDMGQICLYAYGAPLLIDSGRYSYAWPMRQYFHWTIGHNTVMVDEKPQKRRDPLSCKWITNESFDLVRGLTDNSEPLMHERTLVFKQPAKNAPGYWVVIDRLTGDGTHRLDQRWHAYEKLKGNITGSSAVFTTSTEGEHLPALTIASLPQKKLTASIEEGWVSHQWYKKEPVDVAQFTMECEMPATFVTILYPTPPGQTVPQIHIIQENASLDGKEVAADTASAFRVEVNGEHGNTHDLWVFRHGESGIVVAAGARLAGRMARISLETPSSWMAAESAHLSLNGNVLFQSPSRIEAVSQTGNAIYASATDALTITAAAPCTLNGTPAVAPQKGNITWTHVTPRSVPPPPKAFTEPNIDIPPPPEAMKATGFAAMLLKEAPLPNNVIQVNATEFSAQDNGAVEATSNKVGAVGLAFLHWDHADHWLEYTLDVPAGGAYQLLIRACTAEAAAVRKITVNGTVPASCDAQEFAGTGGYSGARDDWRIFTVADTNAKPVKIALPAGETRIRFENTDGRSMNLNWIALVPVTE